MLVTKELLVTNSHHRLVGIREGASVGAKAKQERRVMENNQEVKIQERVAKVLTGTCKQSNICPVKDILARFGDKWSMYTVLLLGQNGKTRFNELKSQITGISQRMLTVTLRSLEEDGIVQRTFYSEIPPRVEYELTNLGLGLLEQLLNLATWADDHFQEIVRARRQYAHKGAAPLEN
jgi:DNA-binding HxlR family transcriptional regulator